MKEKHKVHIFIRGNYCQFFLDLPLEECQRREDERIAKMSDLQRIQELQHELKIIDTDFDDYFFMWFNAGQDINEFANMCLQRLD